LGGMVEAIEIGYPQQEILNSAYQTQKRIEEKEEIIVGVNEFKSEKEEKLEVLKIDEEIEEKQKEKLKVLRKKRNQKEVDHSLENLKKAAIEKVNIFSYVIKCVESYATIGEITKVLKEIYGEYKENLVI